MGRWGRKENGLAGKEIGHLWPAEGEGDELCRALWAIGARQTVFVVRQGPPAAKIMLIKFKFDIKTLKLSNDSK
jgi:hypothetical protein